MEFLVRAIDADQNIRSVLLDAQDESHARLQAQARQLTALSVSRRRLVWRRRAKFPLALFAQELHALLSAGLAVTEALETLIEKETQPHRLQVLEQVQRDLREGKRLSAALAAQPHVFPALFVGVIRAAEGTSDLPAALSRLIQYETRLAAVRHKVVSAAIYPTILLFVGAAVTLFLLGYVVPRFAAVYQEGSRDLPWASAMLLKWGQLVSEHSMLFGAAFAGVVTFAVVALRRGASNGALWQLLRLAPGARERVEAMELSRFYLTLGMLLEGGVPIQRALELCNAVLSRDKQAALQALRSDVAAGYAFTESLDRHGLSTPVAIRFLRVGERSAQLGVMLGRAAAFYDEATGRWIERFTRAFEPVLMAAIGIVIGLIVILLYMPIFDLAGSLQ